MNKYKLRDDAPKKIGIAVIFMFLLIPSYASLRFFTYLDTSLCIIFAPMIVVVFFIIIVELYNCFLSIFNQLFEEVPKETKCASRIINE